MLQTRLRGEFTAKILLLKICPNLTVSFGSYLKKN